jgi:broad specificity phosphatase PhoE
MPNHVHPLTDLGVAQAQAAGRYLADMACQGLLPPIDRILYSPYTRTEQTLEHLISGVRDYCKEKSLHESVVFEGGDRCQVDVNPWVRERYWSDFERLPADQKEEGYQKRTVEPYLWTPAGDSSGETMAGVADRARSFLRSMRRSEYSGEVVLVVTHGEFMNAVEMVTHRDNPLAEDFKKAFERGVPNCGIMAISRLGFQREMPRMQEPLSGFSHELKVVPYQVSEARNSASHGSEWSTAEWQRITKKTKSCVGSFTARPTSQQVDEFASLAQSRGIGVGRALKPRA